MSSISGKRAVLLIVALLVMTVISVLTGVYLSTIVTEKRGVDDERLLVQALHLAEAGANHGVAELRQRLTLDLRQTVGTRSSATYFYGYVTANDPLGFLRDNGYVSGDTQFAINGTEAYLNVTSLALNTGVEGNYTGTRIRIRAPQPPEGNLANETFRFHYEYWVESTGQITRYAQPLNKQVVVSPKRFTIVVRRDNFAKFSLFTGHHRTKGGTRVWFTNNTNFNGPVHTNERFCFAGNPSAHFTEQTSQHLQKAYFYNNGSEKLLDDDHNGTRDVPVFDQGFTRNADEISLTSTITQEDLKNYTLGSGGEKPNGIYVINDGTRCTGGIYVRGNQGQSSDNANISLSVDGSNRQVVTINQGGANTTVTIDAVNNQTLVTTSSGTVTYQGIPDGTGHQGVIIYCNDDIKNFSGTVQENTKMTVSSERDIKITNHIKYQSYTASPLSAEGTNNVLGILSWGGDVRIGTTAPDDIVIHGVVMAPHGVFTVDDYDTGTERGTATLLGGVITDYYGAFGTFGGMWGDTGYGRNFVYDSRMLEGVSPPYFPYMTTFNAFLEPSDVLMQKLVWQEK